MNIKKYLADTIYRLSADYSLKDIAVETILNESRVSRGTFYKYFANKNELIEWSLLALLENQKDIRDNIENCLLIIYNSKDLVDLEDDSLFDNWLLETMVICFIQAYKNLTGSQSLAQEKLYSFYYKCGGAFCLMHRCKKNQLELPLDIIVDDMYQIFN